MRRPSSSLVASLVVSLAAAEADAAIVLSRTIDVVIDPSGKVTETHSIRIRLETDTDRDEWSPYPILVDDNRKVEILDAAVEKSDGSVVKVDKKARDLVSFFDGSTTHDSSRYRTIAFPESPAGSILRLIYKVEIRPYFPADSISLLSGATTDNLQIRISGGGSAFRYRIDGGPTTAVVTPVAGGLTVTGVKLEKRPELKFASTLATRGPILRYGWGNAGKWEEVGDWYLGLLTDVPRGSPTVRQEAVSLKAADDRATIARLVEHVRSKVRYVAVEVGIGGYRPHPPEEVRTKAWGDCKDKATLLIDMLDAAGIEAFPALILSAGDSRIDAEFPSAGQFNHMIVAIPAARLGAPDGLAIADGYYFIDPTQEKGGLQWFGSSTQDQQALVVKPGASRLVRTPRMKGADVRVTEVQVTPRVQGGFEGKATLRFVGDLGSYFVHESAVRRTEEFRGDAESTIKARLPGGDVRFTEFTKGTGDVPEVTFVANVSLPMPASSRSLVLPSKPFTPPLATLEGRVADVVLDVPVATTKWKVELPQGWCAPNVAPVSVDNEIGLFSQKIEASGQTVAIERHLEIRQPWISKEQFPKLRELILAEHRTNARSLRFECAPAS
jgi:hypothetical protein